MATLICGKHNLKLKHEESGISVIELDDNNMPYALWKADLYKCPLCSNPLVGGFAQQPYAHQWEDSFAEEVQEVIHQKKFFKFY